MSVSAELWQRVRKRAVWLASIAGSRNPIARALAVDHYHPTTRGGTDDFENVLYCCYRCNLYKADYWPAEGGPALLWNPRREPMSVHLLLLADGMLFPATPVGTFTLDRLRLNRSPLVAYRLKKSATLAERRLLSRYENVVTLLEKLCREQAELLAEQQALLEEQQSLLRLWFGSQN